MNTIWKGSVNFGLINIPVKLSAATDKKDVSFRLLHKQCKQPLNQKRWCPKCNKEVAFEDTVKGYEYEKGRFTIIEDEDFAKLPVKSTRYIQIVDFIQISEVDPIYYEKTYYLQPEANSEKAYLLLRDAMKETGKAAVAKITLRQKEHICIVRCIGKVLCMETMFFIDEIRGAEEIGIDKLEKKMEVSKQERDIAVQLIENLTAKFEPEKYHDEYREELMKMIQTKIDGAEIVESAPIDDTLPNVIDLMERLKRSVEATQVKKIAN
ncbi:non-homologous end joining protein Ku [Clostridia bacterium]|nr:non-homologous end joining protein Ku [Clostridia bacterium]